MASRIEVKLQVHEAEAAQILHLPFAFECPICGKEQQHVLICLLCGALLPAECEDPAHDQAPDEFWSNGIKLGDVVRTRWLGPTSPVREELEGLAQDPANPITKTSLGFLDEHSRPKRPKDAGKS
jgi:hypothetical protein